jgi:hypothetical protein
MSDIEKLFYTTILDLFAQLGKEGRTLRKSLIYSSTLIALAFLGFGLIRQASSQSENLKVLNYSWYFDSIGGFHIVGEVQNVGTTILNPVVLGGTIYTPDGTPQIRSNPCVVYVNYMLPKQKAPFLMDFALRDMSWMSQGIDNVEFTVIEGKANSSYQYPNIAIRSSSLSTDSTGVYWASGSVQNTGNQTATNVRVIGTFYNATNSVVAVGYSELLTPKLLNPSSSASFKVGAFDVNKTETPPDRQISSYTLIVQSEGPLLSGTPPESTAYSSSNSSSTQSPSSSDSPSDGNSFDSAAPDYLPYIAVIATIIVPICILVMYSKRKTSKTSTEKTTKSQPVGKRRQPPRKRYRND